MSSDAPPLLGPGIEAQKYRARQEKAISGRFQAPSLLLFGASICLVGFSFITAIGIIEFEVAPKNSKLHREYPSGNGYWPSTVSELVHSHESPTGKVFHTFGMISGACIFVSFYPYHLRNVYTGDETIPFTGGVYWTTFRQICPAMGLWLLVGVSTYPTTIAMASHGKVKVFCVFIHVCGAAMMFLGYLLCEFKCLGLVGFKPKKGFLAIEGRERNIRTVLAYLILISFALFSVFQILLIVGKESVCCGDVWAFKGDEVTLSNGETLTVMGPPQVTDTAKGTFLIFKMLSFAFEDLGGLCVVCSHLAVWWFCEERMVEYGDIRLKEVFRQED